MTLTERDYFLGLSVFPDIGPVRFRLLLQYFKSAQNIWEAPEKQLNEINLGKTIVEKFIQFRRTFSFSLFKQIIADKKITFLTANDREYPRLLFQIKDRPIVIFCRGNTELLKSPNIFIAVVGSRLMSSYGSVVTAKIVAELVKKNVIIVSGLANGIDTRAHKTALESGGATVAVLGSGIDMIYPAANTGLYFQIIKNNGLIISEYPPGFAPSKSTFPLRNRIISGLSKAVVVIEGRKTSGSLITAKYAADQGREVFAVPGPVNSPMSEATSYLLKNGAALAAETSDILNTLLSPAS